MKDTSFIEPTEVSGQEHDKFWETMIDKSRKENERGQRLDKSQIFFREMLMKHGLAVNWRNHVVKKVT